MNLIACRLNQRSWIVLGALALTLGLANRNGAEESATSPAPGESTVGLPGEGGLRWESQLKEHRAAMGEERAQFSFSFTNVSATEIVIQSARSSCFCTVAKLPREPWPIAAGGTGTIEVAMDLRGKRGTVEKPITVETSQGTQTLRARVVIPEGSRPGGKGGPNESERTLNMQAALQDRQVVFKNAECAKCHAEPAIGKAVGAQIYAAVCANCHDSPNRAPMVPDLRQLNHPTDATHWRKWIAGDMPGTLMPAFAISKGGPLSDAQIEAVVQFLDRTFPSAEGREETHR